MEENKNEGKVENAAEPPISDNDETTARLSITGEAAEEDPENAAGSTESTNEDVTEGVSDAGNSMEEDEGKISSVPGAIDSLTGISGVHNTNSKVEGYVTNRQNDSDEKVDEDPEEEKIKEETDNENPRDLKPDLVSDDDESSSDDDSDEKAPVHTTADGHEISEYEMLRLERIKRNRDYLAQLGLEGALGKKRPVQKKKKKIVQVEPNERRSSLSRRSKERSINYLDSSASITQLVKDENRGKGRPKKPPGEKKNKAMNQRCPRFIYDEFKGVSRHAKMILKQAKRDVRRAEKEIKFWRKRAEIFAKKEKARLEMEKRRMEIERIMREQKEERDLLGGTMKELLREVDTRASDLILAASRYDREQQQLRLNQELIRKRQEAHARAEAKMKTLDAMQQYPRAMKYALSVLNSAMLERAPKDPPPPRRSKRSATSEAGDEETAKKKKKRKVGSAPKQNSDKWQATTLSAELENLSQDNDLHDKDHPSEKIRKKKMRNVGGWVSPDFARKIKRFWLESDAVSKKFALSRFIPQVGDTVLYFPSGHRAHLTEFPDFLGKKTRAISRLPLWVRASMEKERAEQAKSKGEPPASSANWWNEYWLSNVEADLGNYPLVCRVERTHAEFPPDPYSKVIIKEDDAVRIAWKNAKTTSAPQKNKAMNHRLRLAVTLRPLTSVLPPSSDNSLALPPLFSVVTFPSSLKPYLVPFAWAYSITHSLDLNQMVSQRSTDGSVDSTKVCTRSFNAPENGSVSFQLNDKVDTMTNILTKLKPNGSSDQSALEKALASHPRTLPLADSYAVLEVWKRFLDEHPRQDGNLVTVQENNKSISLYDLVRHTLPLWEGVSISSSLHDRKTRNVSPWDLLSASSKAEALQAASHHDTLAQTLRVMDEGVATKIEVVIEDFVANEKPDADIFFSPLTDEIAPSYSLAVPIGMCFSKILQRLNASKVSKQGCYYRGVEALLSDVSSILDNCLLYNNPDSDVVLIATRVISNLKQDITKVVQKHFREQKRCRRVMATCSSERDRSLKSQSVAVMKTIRSPYMGPLHRDWLQQPGPDSRNGCSHNFATWMPQAGDCILYSGRYHLSFVKGHCRSLQGHQCEIFRPKDTKLLSKELSENKLSSRDVSSNIAHTNISVGDQTINGRELGVGGDHAPQYGESKHSDERQVGGDLANRIPPTTCSNSIVDNGEANGDAAMGAVSNKSDQDGLLQAPSNEGAAIQNAEDNLDVPRVIMDVKENAEVAGKYQNVAVCRKQDSQGKGDPFSSARNDSSSTRSNVGASCQDWIPGKVTSVRAEFPLPMLKGSEEIATFSTGSPLLAIGIEFKSSDSNSPSASVIYWRPCLLNCDHSSQEDSDKCPSCGLSSHTSFLRPERRDKPESAHSNDNLAQHEASGLTINEVKSIDRCFSILKRRCLLNVPPGYVEPELTRKNVKNGYLPQGARIGMNSLPSFNALFKIASIAGESSMETRGVSISSIQSQFDDNSIQLLAKTGYLPPWVSSAKKNTEIDAAIHRAGTITPWPKLCLELIHIRLKNGYYRQKAALMNDILEGFVSSVFTLLSEAAGRKKLPISIKRIVRLLLLTKGKKPKGSGADSKNASSTAAHLQTAPSAPKTAPNPNPVYEEETRWADLLKPIRELYATALASVSDTMHVERMFGVLGPLPAKSDPSGVMQGLPVNLARAEARQKVRKIMMATGKDPCFNQFRFRDPYNPHFPLKKVRIVCNFNSTPKKPSWRHAVADRMGNSVRVKVLCDDQLISDEGVFPTLSHTIWEREGINVRVKILVGGKVVPSSIPSTEVESLLEKNDTVDPVWTSLPTQFDGPPIFFGMHDYRNNAALSQLFFGRPQLMNACARCQVFKRSFLDCRLVLRHSNVDFDWKSDFNGLGTISSLLNVLDPTLFPPNEVIAANPGNLNQPCSTVALPTSQQRGVVIPEPQKQKEPDPSICVQNAELALSLAKEVLQSAEAVANAPPRMSKEFIKEQVPIDPEDDHCVYCVICGLSGDLLCCDGCPNVVHTKCIALSTIPDGDWFCDECVLNKANNREPNGNQQEFIDEGIVKDAAVVPHSESQPEMETTKSDNEHDGGKTAAPMSSDVGPASKIQETPTKPNNCELVNMVDQTVPLHKDNKTDSTSENDAMKLDGEESIATAKTVDGNATFSSKGGPDMTQGPTQNKPESTMLKSDSEHHQVGNSVALPPNGISEQETKEEENVVLDGIKKLPFGRVEFDYDKAGKLTSLLENLRLRRLERSTQKTENNTGDDANESERADEEVVPLDSKKNPYSRRTQKLPAGDSVPDGLVPDDSVPDAPVPDDSVPDDPEDTPKNTTTNLRRGRGRPRKNTLTDKHDVETDGPNTSRNNYDDTHAGENVRRGRRDGIEVSSLESCESVSRTRSTARRNKSSRNDALDSLSDTTRRFLRSVAITTAEAFLTSRTKDLADALVRWRKKEKMPALRGSGAIATISGWKTSCRNAAKALGMKKIADLEPEQEMTTARSSKKQTTKIVESNKKRKKPPATRTPSRRLKLREESESGIFSVTSQNSLPERMRRKSRLFVDSEGESGKEGPHAGNTRMRSHKPERQKEWLNIVNASSPVSPLPDKIRDSPMKKRRRGRR